MPIKIPGPKPAMNSAEIEVLVEIPYTTIGMLGGIIMPKVPAAQINPIENFLEYPVSCSCLHVPEICFLIFPDNKKETFPAL